MVRARLHVSERLSASTPERLADRGALIADEFHLSARKVDEQPLFRHQGIGASEHQGDDPITNAVGSAGLPDVLLGPGRFIDHGDVGSQVQCGKDREHPILNRARCAQVLEDVIGREAKGFPYRAQLSFQAKQFVTIKVNDGNDQKGIVRLAPRTPGPVKSRVDHRPPRPAVMPAESTTLRTPSTVLVHFPNPATDRSLSSPLNRIVRPCRSDRALLPIWRSSRR